MKILITGSPGSGKTTLSRSLGKLLKAKVFNETEIALKHGITEFDVDESELVLPLERLEKAANAELRKNKLAIVEGHVLCETRLKVDLVIVLRVDPEILEERLERKGYSAEKVQDNVFCEGIDYCKKHVLRQYSQKKVVEMGNENIKQTIANILKELKKRGIK